MSDEKDVKFTQKKQRFLLYSPKFMLFLVLFFTSIISPGCARENSSQEKKELFLKYQTAIQAQDFVAWKSILSSDAVNEMESSGLDFQTVATLIQSMTPPVVRIKEPLPSEDGEDLLLEGIGEGFEDSKGRVIYVREDGKWKIAKIAWEMTFDFGLGDTSLDGIGSPLDGIGSPLDGIGSPLDGIGSPWDPDYKIDLSE